MKYRAVVKKPNGWWIGWLIDLPGVNAHERNLRQLVESLRIDAQDMLATEIPFEPDAQMAMVEIPDPEWATGSGPL